MARKAPTTRILFANRHRAGLSRWLIAVVQDREGCEVAYVRTPEAMAAAIESRPFDCVVIEQHGQDTTFTDGLSEVRGRCATQPIVLLTPAPTSHESDRHLFSLTHSQAIEPHAVWHAIDAVIAGQGMDHVAAPQSSAQQDNAGDVVSRLRQIVGDCTATQSIACIQLDIDGYHKTKLDYGETAARESRDAMMQIVRDHLEPADAVLTTASDRIVVLRPDTEEVDAWLWADEIRHRIVSLITSTSQGALRMTVSAGVAAARASLVDMDLVDASRSALRLAKQNGRNQVCTRRMVATLDQLELTTRDAPADCMSKRDAFLERLTCRDEPVKREHITAHCEEVSRVAVLIAERLGFSREEIESIRQAGLLHDIGKCLIPEAILAKPRPLTAEEWQIMARHDEFGTWIARQLGASPMVVQFIREHHRRYDEAMVDELLPMQDAASIGGNLLCVADALVTMLSQRAYRKPMTLSGAMVELNRCSGKQFDPTVVACVHALETSDLRKAA